MALNGRVGKGFGGHRRTRGGPELLLLLPGRSGDLLIQRREDVGVAHDVARAAGGDLVDVHVEAPGLVPGQEAMEVVDLRALGFEVVADVAALASGLPAKSTIIP